MVQSTDVKPAECPLCHSGGINFFSRDKRRHYYQCAVCHLVFVAAEDFLSAAEEKQVYDQHQNSPDDLHYRRFLSRLYAPMVQQLLPACHGLDFGSGPGPTLSVMFTEAGHKMDIYDHYYANNQQLWAQTYDFISATEVVEHLQQPRFELERLWQHLKVGGILGIMTKRVKSVEAFAAWHYKNDPTHVMFFSQATFCWLAELWQAEIQFIGDDVVIFGKKQV